MGDLKQALLGTAARRDDSLRDCHEHHSVFLVL